MKKIIFALSVLLLVLPGMTVFAGQTIVTEINPFMTGGQRQVTVREIPDGAGGEFQACDDTVSSYSTFKLAVLRRMRLKDTEFTLCFQSGYQPSESIFLGWWDQMKTDQDVPWLNMSWSNVSYRYSYTSAGLITQSAYTIVFLHNQQQEAQLESAVRDKVRQLIGSGTDMPTREKVIHDFVVHQVTYDQSLVKHSDYDAFFVQSAVCQGYALLTDRMLAMAGIEDIIVEGKAGGDHAWNMVKICDTWFHLDTTWDDPTGMGPDYIRWDYFNLTDGVMGADHSWNTGDYPSCTTTYVDGYCYGEVRSVCSIFEPQKCLNEFQCIKVGGSWNGSCLVPGSGGGGGTTNGFPSSAMTPVDFPGSVNPAGTPVTVPAGMVALTPQLNVSSCAEVVSAIAYIYMPMANFGLSVPATVACDGGVVTITIGAGSINFTGYPGTYYIYFGYVDGVGTIHYNAYELIVQ
jgi:hypothetical protein